MYEGKTCGITLVNLNQLFTSTQCVKELKLTRFVTRYLYDGRVVLGTSNYPTDKGEEFDIVDIQADFRCTNGEYEINIAVVTVSHTINIRITIILIKK